MSLYLAYSLIIDQYVPCCYISVDIFLEGKVHQTKCNLSRVAQQRGTQFSSNRLIRATNQILSFESFKLANGLTLVLLLQDNDEGHLYALALLQSCTVKEARL